MITFLYRYRFIIIWCLFFLTRVYILAYPPPNYSDVKQDYERYANIWWYGMEPYLEHYYEYPPATIPFLIFPLFFDQLGIGSYYLNYRILIFLFEVGLFSVLLKTLRALPLLRPSKLLALGFYLVMGVLAKNFWYEGIDLLFAGSLAIGLCSLVIFPHTTAFHTMWQRIVFWFFFWFSVAIKFMSLPLLPLFLLARLSRPKHELFALGIGFLLVWLGPGLWYRSSLQVSYVFHAHRSLKYSSVGSYFIEVVNHVTHSETRSPEPPDFAMQGRISTIVNAWAKLIFPLSIAGFLVWGGYLLEGKQWFKPWQWCVRWLQPRVVHTSQVIYPLLIKLTLVYITLIFVTAKVFSQPFPIWLVVLGVLYPYGSLKTQLSYLSFIGILVMLMTSPFIQLPLTLAMSLPVTLDFTMQTVRIGVMMLLLGTSVGLVPLATSVSTHR